MRALWTYLNRLNTDMRKSIDGLCTIVEKQLKMDPASSSLFLFCGRRRDRIKALFHEPDGVLLLTKRFLAGNRFQWLRTPDEARALTTEQFRRLMDGFTIEGTIKEIFPSKKANLENSRTQA